MARRTKTNRLMGLTGACVLMAASALAAPTIRSVTVAQDDRGERLFLNWNEATAVQIDRFPEARQVVLTLPGATVASADVRRFDLPANSGIEKARLQEVTLASGQSAVQLTLTLRAGADVSPVATPNSLTVLVSGATVPTLAPPAPLATEGITITNADLAEFGSADAPVTGAGQAATTSTPAFFVPPDVSESDRRDDSADDQSVLRTSEKFREVIKNLDVKDAELLFVLRGFAKKANMNIIVNPADVKGRITVSLQNVMIGDALDAILKANELAYKVEPGGIIRIVKRKEVRSTAKETVTQAVPINWVAAAEAKKALMPFLSEEVGKIEVAEAANTLIIQEVPENMIKMQELIKKIDAPQKQVKMEVRMVDLTDEASRTLGFRTNFQSDATKTVDFFDDEGVASSIGDFRTSGGAGSAGTGSGLNLNHLTSATFLGNSYDLDMQLNALEERAEAVVLANPVVMSLDNRPASIQIIRKIPYLSAQQGGDSGVVTVETKDSGILVNIIPRITNNGYVQMEVRPEQLIFRELFAVQSGGVTFTDFPLIDERRIVTSVIVKDEETVALGGLRQFESRETASGAPYLLRVPVLSWLFKNTSTEQTRTELVLFVTPRILKDMTPSTYETALYDKIDYNWDLPDYYYDQVKPRKGPNEKDPSAVYGK